MSTSRVSPLQVQPTSFDQLRKFAAGGYLYALLDSYNAPSVPDRVLEFGKEKAVSLFVGQAETKYWELAPYLLSIDEAAMDWVLQTIFASPCGVLVFSKSGLETLRTHFRRFLMVQLPDGERWYFRYYDPRILRLYLHNCRRDELDVFFGPVRAFGLVDDDTQEILLLHTATESRPSTESRISGTIWQVRPEQYQALAQPIQSDFERRLLKYVKHRFPERCNSLGESGTSDLIQQSLKKAAGYGLSREADIGRLVELIFLLGPDFDQNPKLPWVPAILQDVAMKDHKAKLSRILEIAKEQYGGGLGGS